MDEFFEILDWPDSSYSSIKTGYSSNIQNNENENKKNTLLDSNGFTEDNSNSVLKENSQNNTVICSEPQSSFNLKDPPDINEILELDEINIKPTPHNVSVLNAACQKVLIEMESTLLNLLEKNRADQEIVLNYLNSNEKPTVNSEPRKKTFSSLCIPFFKNELGYPPPQNQDVIRKKRNHSHLSVESVYVSHIWSPKDSNLLVKAVNEEQKEKSNGKCIDANSIDWMKISASYMNEKFTDSECKSKWILHSSPSVNKSPWKSNEVKNLMSISKKYGKQNWDEIAIELGTNRTGFQCCVKYHIQHNRNGSRWSKEEDSALISLVKQYQIKDYIPWKKVAWNVDGRTLRQCYERYNYHLQDIKKGYFTKQEDFLLVYLYSQLHNFREVGKYFPYRVPPQIRARYEYLVKSAMPKFTKEEDKLLAELVVKYARNWNKISEHFTNRSKLQCRKRWADIQKEISLKVKNDNESDSDVDSVDLISDENPNTEKQIKLDANVLNPSLTSSSSRKKKQHSFSPEYVNLMNYCKHGYKFLFGPKPRQPTEDADKKLLCDNLIISMKSLGIENVKSSFDVAALSNDCEFDAEDVETLKRIKKSEEDNETETEIEVCHKIIPPNYVTLVGARTLTLNKGKIKNLCEFYKKDTKSIQTGFSDNERMLFSDAKKLFKSRLKTLFAFPLILSNISPNVIDLKNVKKGKAKKSKPLSQRQRKNHSKMMRAHKKSSSKVKKMINKILSDQKCEELPENDETVGKRNEADEKRINGDESTTMTSSDSNVTKVKRKRGRPPKNLKNGGKKIKLSD